MRLDLYSKVKPGKKNLQSIKKMISAFRIPSAQFTDNTFFKFCPPPSIKTKQNKTLASCQLDLFMACSGLIILSMCLVVFDRSAHWTPLPPTNIITN